MKQAPSQRFRFEQYLEALVSAGHSVDSQSFWREYHWKILYSEGKQLQKALGLINGFCRRLRVLWSLPKYDLVFIHREATPLGPPVFEWAIAKIFRKKIIYDFDDAIWLPNTSRSNQLAAGLKWHQKTASICRWAWKVSAGNSFLAAYAGRFCQRVTINPTTIDTRLHQPKNTGQCPSGSGTVIGWTGSHSTLLYLDTLWPVLERLHAEHPFYFHLIADRPAMASFPWLIFVPWKKETEVADLAKIDIGLMPLTDDDWSRGKCGFKILQYMALGIVPVASPVGVNHEIIRHGQNGLLCSTAEEWYAALKKLLTDQELRDRLGQEGVKTVRAAYSVESNTVNFLSLFNS